MGLTFCGCGFNRSTQHSNLNPLGFRSVEDETATSNPLHRKPEGADVGALEARRLVTDDSPVVRPEPFLDSTYSGGDGGAYLRPRDAAPGWP